MSIAGIRSNRGDGYQTLVAFDWALIVLSDPDFEWLEVDSISYSVDDVVVGRTDGTLIACQCKKNQTDFKAWTIADLGDELDKAFLLLANDPRVSVRFYSRNNFGDLAKLKEHSSSQPDEMNYLQSLGKAQRVLNDTLTHLLKKTAPDLSVFEFLCRTNFITSDDIDQMELQLRGRLRSIASNHEAAFNALWVSIEKLGARLGGGGSSTAAMHRLTKNDLRNIVQQSGSTLVPPMGIAEILHSFSSTSAIGRSWRRDIARQRIANPILDELLAAIDARKKSILLTGLPGSGKTCVMLELQEALEERAVNCSDIAPLFIQSREFADLATAEERQAQGLSQQWVEKAARLAESAYVIVVIDSLDVLSIAREHRVLQYFLAQIDRLLLIPNITVVTACREFDRHYDRRIAERHWDCEFECQPLNWDVVVAPLLDTLKIAATEIDIVTRELIRNPRELALFVELALRGGSFNVVTSHALAQRYLNNIVLADVELGDMALQAIEALATEMLRLRSLTAPRQRFTASLDIERKLCSLNVLQETVDGKLTFGHQTLLDVLVISRAIRNGVTLNEFIKDLPPVPFVRPSIRSFIAQLAIGERREFRKQLRTVLTGDTAFHIRRLAAESFAEQTPQNEDWSLIRDLRENYRDVFQVIYTAGRSVEWHHFWMKFLCPNLITNRDIEGLKIHVHRIAQWSNADTVGVVSFWTEIIELDYFDNKGIADQLARILLEIEHGNLQLVAPLLQRLLDMPLSEYSSLGEVIAKCVAIGVVDDIFLWRYITVGLTDENILKYSFENELRCRPHEFGIQNENFLKNRMMRSSTLLDLAVDAIEYWSQYRESQYKNPKMNYRYGFLSETSYERNGNLLDIHHAESINVLFEAVEASVLYQAKIHSDWWQQNSERLCLNHEGALLYFCILACTISPLTNLSLIERILCSRNILEFDVSHELDELIQASFRFLPVSAQDAVMDNILTIWEKYESTESELWVLEKKAALIASIPCYLRSLKAQAVVDKYEKKAGIIVRQPKNHSYENIVRAPFPFEIFLGTSDKGVLKLLMHYDGHSDCDGIKMLVGGEREVGSQLREASSRNPSRFLRFLSNYWAAIPENFLDDIMMGVTTYLAHRYGNLSPNEGWTPIEDPDSSLLASQILDELERHSKQWQYKRSTAKAIQACSHVIHDQLKAERLIFLTIGFAWCHEYDLIKDDSVSLLSLGMNMAKGNISESLMIVADNLIEHEIELPQLLVPTLRRFASDEHLAVRATILRRLPYLQSKDFDLGWDLFHLAMKDAYELWKIAERCLYYAYHRHFKIVKPLLARLWSEGRGNDMEIWGRISALAAMTQHIPFETLLDDLYTLDSTEAWYGAATVWTNAENIQRHREQCFSGVNAGLKANSKHALKVAGQVIRIFQDKREAISVPTELISNCFSVFEKDSNNDNKKPQPYGFNEWLNKLSQHDPKQALVATEIYVAYVRNSKLHMYDNHNNLTQLMTHLFAEAEEHEESDCGAMLQRVVSLQDSLLSMGIKGIADWLRAAERP